MTLSFDPNALISFLRDQGVQPEFHKESGQLFVTYKIKGHEVPIFFLLHTESELLQMVAYLPYQIPKENLGEIARMLHLLNKELDMPGFCMDEIEKLIFYRAVLPCPDKTIDQRLFTMYLGATRLICETFMHAIGAVVSGNLSVDKALQSKK